MSTHLDIGPVHHGAAPDRAQLIVYGVHGRTQSPDFMIEQADRLGLDEVAWVLPAAAGNSWYPGKFMEEHSVNQPQLDQALQVVETQLGRLLAGRAGGGPPVVVFGFSQGACLLAEYLLTRQPPVDGAVLHTGGYLGPSRRDLDPLPRNGLEGVEVAMFVADQDPWVPLSRARETRHAFESVGAQASLQVYEDTEHHINEDSLSRIRDYLQHRLAG